MFLYSDLIEKYLVVTEVKQVIETFEFNYGLQTVLSFKDRVFFSYWANFQRCWMLIDLNELSLLLSA